jgi:nitrogen fixation NifU-like protein
MDRQQAVAHLLDHYRNPRNRELLLDADVIQPGGAPDCGDHITIFLKVDADSGRVARLTFEGEGCTISQASASVLTELLQEAPLSRVDALEEGELLDLLGREVVASRPRCATLAFNTLKHAVAAYRRQSSSAA